MKNDQTNPWTDRYLPLLNQDYIKKQATLQPEPLGNLYEINPELACRRLKEGLQGTFYPTKQCVKILKRLAGISYAHAVETYPSRQAFISKLYTEDQELTGFAMPICLTGLAGIGKSEILKAFKRITGQSAFFKIDPHHPPFEVKGPTLLTLRTLSTPIQIAKSLFEVDIRANTLASQCQKKAYRDGIPFFMIDEAQFATSSSTANARITQILLSLSYIQIPFIFSANYSLLNRLLLRPEEDRQRLVSDIIFLEPDAWSSECWSKTLQALIDVAPDVLKISPINDAKNLHTWTAGRKRALVDLITLAFRMQYAHQGKVDIRALETAYRSVEFTDYRNDSETIANQSMFNNPSQRRKELSSPIPIFKLNGNPSSDESITDRDELLADIALKSSLNHSERQAVKQIDGLLNSQKNRTSSGHSTKKEKENSQDLLESIAKFRESLGL